MRLILFIICLVFSNYNDSILPVVDSFNAVPCRFRDTLSARPVLTPKDDEDRRALLIRMYSEVSSGEFLETMTAYIKTNSLCSDAFIDLFDPCGSPYEILHIFDLKDQAEVLISTKVAHTFSSGINFTPKLLDDFYQDYALDTASYKATRDALYSLSYNNSEYTVEIITDDITTMVLTNKSGRWLVSSAKIRHKNGTIRVLKQ